MQNRSYRATRGILYIFSAVAVIAGLTAIASSRGLIHQLFPHYPEAELSIIFLATIKELGGLAIMISLLLYFAARDPVRNVAIIDALIVGLLVLAITPLISLATLDVGRVYPAWFFWGRSIVRLLLALLLFTLRPRS